MRRFCLALLVCLWLSGCLLTVAETAPMTVDGLTDGITAAFNGSPVIRVTVPQDATALTVPPSGRATRRGNGANILTATGSPPAWLLTA